MPLIKNGEITADAWRYVDEEETPTADDKVIVTLAQWRDHRETLLAANGNYGVSLASDDELSEILDDLPRLDVIVLNFKAFSDGRPFSQARLLRERHGFKGELRVRGHVIRDQYLYLDRAGVDTLEVDSEKAAEEWKAAIAEIQVFYQPTGDNRDTALSRRLAARRVAAE